MDGTAAADLFENAARYEAELTDRQREVLRMIAAGRTNGDIADALDMTLAGAKWHVSELLTKLGLESREAAAAYYRWRETPHRRFARSARGLLSATALKVGLGVAAGGVAVVAGAAALFAMNGHEPNVGPAEPGLPFFLEAKVGRTDANMGFEADARFWFEN
jgi:DNA-binding CsgD family transcriptional regulator